MDFWQSAGKRKAAAASVAKHGDAHGDAREERRAKFQKVAEKAAAQMKKVTAETEAKVQARNDALLREAAIEYLQLHQASRQHLQRLPLRPRGCPQV